MASKEAVSRYLDAVKSGQVRDGCTLYALKVRDREVLAGPWVRLACKRHLKDLERDDLIWDLDAANHAIDFFPDMLRFTDGDKAGDPFDLELWQQFIVGCLFGWKGLDGWRRFRTAYVEIGKGNGKSPLAGGIGLYLLAADGEAAAEVYAAATKLDQAKILWNDAKRMAESSPILCELLEIRSNALVLVDNHSVFKPISSEKRGLDGPRVHGGLIDEIHEHADSTVVDKLRAGTKARKQALIVEITNSGHDKQSVCFQHHEFTLRVLKGIEKNDTWFGFICALDPEDLWETDEDCWIKANPNLGVSIQLKYLREQVNEAKGMPGKRSIVERLNFCRWVGSEKPWIDEAKWVACQVETSRVDWAALKKYKCYLGLDLSARKDLTALAAVWKLPEGLVARVWYFTPEMDVERRAKQDRAPYDVWLEENWIIGTPGSIIDYSFVAAKIAEINAEYQVEGLAFDPWRIGLLEKELDDLGVEIELVKHGQAYTGGAKEDTLWMPKSIEKWEELILSGRYWVEQNPVTLMCAANAMTTSDPAGNRKFDKKVATGRMDGTVAQAMAIGLAEAEIDSSSVYERRELVLI